MGRKSWRLITLAAALSVAAFFAFAPSSAAVWNDATGKNSAGSEWSLKSWWLSLRSKFFGAHDTRRAARVYYLSPNGHSDAPGTREAPLKGLGAVTKRLRAGDTLYLLPGIYPELSDLEASGRPGSPITIEGIGRVIIDGARLPYYSPAFDTRGHSYLRFKNLEVHRSRAGVQVSPGSSDIEIDGLKTWHSQFAVKISDSTGVTVRDAFAVHARNAFRAEGKTSQLVFERIRTYFSKDIYDGYDRNYRNGDGFILESSVRDVVIRDVVSAGHWDAGFDIKASRVKIENIVAFGNKNGLKLWGKDIEVDNALIFKNRRQKKPDGSYVDGNGLNVREGNTRILNATIVDNDDIDVKLGTSRAALSLQDSIVARRAEGQLLYNHHGKFNSKDIRWFHEGLDGVGEAGVPVLGSRWEAPVFRSWDEADFRPTGDASVVGARVAELRKLSAR